ncbi:MAG: hypothetical protein P9L88_07995 [Candidatus Tantalella remota]|nr:hypothetical protein [Candidatus Tantalella remota]
MLTKKYNNFQREVRKQIGPLRKKKKINKADFDGFIKKIMSNKKLSSSGKIYCRDGAAYVHKVDSHTFQILAFQVNSFGAGIFSKGIKKLCTPVMITVTAHGTHRHLQHSLKDACISIDEFYLGKDYSGSKGPLCDRKKFMPYAEKLFISQKAAYSFNHQIVYNIMNANYLCHHIAEVMGYVFGALDIYWTFKKDIFFMASGTWFNQNKHKLYMNIIENFSGDRMSGHFQIPHYAKLSEDVERFKEEFDILLCSIDYKKTMETFYLPIGYQVMHRKRFNKNVNVITSQHILEHLLSEYYKRENIFVVTNTFQTLEYLSRAMLAKLEGADKEFSKYMKTVTSCQGYYPERDFEKIYEQKESKFSAFVSEYSHSMFFRAPVLK